MPKRALLSVSDKAGLPGFARGLARLGYEIYSTGGTLAALQGAAVDAQPVSDLTGFPEIMDGRVKTLHPGVHAGLLARRDDPAHMAALDRHGLNTIDLLCVNLYRFAETAARPGVSHEEVVEQIDIGGPAMIRAAAKNYRHVVVVVRPERYTEVLAALGQKGEMDQDMRARLAAEAYGHTAGYDAQIAAWMRGPGDDLPSELSVSGTRTMSLRYGENPHQQAAFYRIGVRPGGLGSLNQIQGQDLSFNNLQDASAALDLVNEFERPAAAIIKHMNPCGLAVAPNLGEAYRRAYECDTTSAFGGVVALNRPLDVATAEQIASIFVEVVIAPSVEDGAKETMARRSKVRVLEVDELRNAGYDVRSVPGGLLVQTWDRAGFNRANCRVVTQQKPTDEQWSQLEFAWLAVKHVKSNAIVLAKEFAAVGVGAGQMSRVEAAQLAVERAGDRASGTVMASDAFFPFPDGAQVGIDAGVKAIIQPGGSIRDEEVVKAADEAGVAMVMTGERHFRH
ncbi:MAG TPA: bifunctional phosphoribosylaminoimidazolecarboxamide formyltransferase/IMP cyclohydrolase [Candidatus Dormibacteraeota bacterium]|nr:bifunctional phosphoribosylaminoimidazolecarboxamide formyltransferase/IMP cyclohydrolase [Candidatus Dormibacteraeota bacterium]